MALADEVDNAPVPRPLAVLAAWSWRVLLGGAALWFTLLVFLQLSVLVIPILVALFLAAVLEAPVDWLRRRGVPSLMGAWVVFLASIAGLVGLGWWTSTALAGQFGQVGEQAALGIDQVKEWLRNGPLGLSASQLDRLSSQVESAFRAGQGGLLRNVVGGIRFAGQLLAGVALLFFSLFFFLKDGRRIADWVLERTPARYREDISAIAGNSRLVMRQYLLATTITGLIDGSLIAIALVLIGVPLVFPLAVLTFVGAFFPLIGAFLAGLVSALVALVAKGLTAALLVVGATILVQQIEGHLLQPLVLGRAVHLHPLVTAWSVAAGLILAGIAGGFLAVPVTATVVRVAHFYRCRDAEDRPGCS